MATEYDELKSALRAAGFAYRADSGLQRQSEDVSQELAWRWWRARIRGLEDFYDLRRRWSRSLVKILWTLIALQAVLLGAVGLGLLQFADYKPFLAAQAGVYFLQIAGMCLVVVKFLFHDPPAATSPESGWGKQQDPAPDQDAL